MKPFVACYWAYCGEGTCTKSRTHTHMCQCKQGFSNLLNISAFPCFSECIKKQQFFSNSYIVFNKTVLVFLVAKMIGLCLFEGTLGSDCSRLGIRVADSTAGGGSSSNDKNQG